MNFTQPSDFQFVQGANIDDQHPYGDLDRIEIDNDIMPVRTSEEKKRLRGIDIAFLMEAVEERARAIGLGEKDWTFSRNITLEQVNSIIGRLNEILNVNEGTQSVYYFDVDKFRKINNTTYTGEDPRDFYLEKVNRLTINPVSDSTILLSKIDELFECVKDLQFIYRGRIHTLWYEGSKMATIDTVESRGSQTDTQIRNFSGKVFYANCSYYDDVSTPHTTSKFQCHSTSGYFEDEGLKVTNDFDKSFADGKCVIFVFLEKILYPSFQAESHHTLALSDVEDGRATSYRNLVSIAEMMRQYWGSPPEGTKWDVYTGMFLPQKTMELRDRTRWDVEQN